MTPATPRSLLRAFGVAAALSLLAGLLVVASPAVATSRYLCTGYVACKQAGYPHFRYKAAGSQMWWRMYSGHNCTNYVAYRLVKGGMSPERPWSSTGMAYNWGRANRSITDTTPMVGAVAWWDSGDGVGSSGHVAYVQQVLSNRKIVISEDSWSGDFHWRVIRKRGGGWPTGFIHFNDRAVRAVVQPTVTGSPAVGQALTLDPGRWKPSPTLEVQWRSGNRPIPGATGLTFTPTPEQLWTRLSVRVAAAARGYRPAKAITEQTVRVARGTMTATSMPSLSGTARVGEQLTVSGGSASPTADSSLVRWYADGQRLAGATGERLALTPALRGREISAVVVLRRDAYRNLRLGTEKTAAVAPGRMEITEPFTLTGRTRYGRLLTVAPGAVTPADATVRYTWLRDGSPITGADGTSYRLGAADVGHEVSVRLVLRRDGYRGASVVLPATGTVTTRPKLNVEALGGVRRAIVKLRVTAPGVEHPAGRVTVTVAGQEITGTVNDGRLRLVVRGIEPGRYRVRVSYLGTKNIEPASLVTDRVRVRRR
ncbi:CHAP domain-containing protein [Nocardioides sp.]|uniref:CHAP domain-containing protein n=1 Tax=Nocardioides sp. TaxID=35761 RepID=UPI002ED2AD49